MLQVKNGSEKYLHAQQNQFDANDMWLPLGEFFFCIVRLCPALMERVDKGSFQRLPIVIHFLFKEPNFFLNFGLPCM